jgi:hypothetical protein
LAETAGKVAHGQRSPQPALIEVVEAVGDDQPAVERLRDRDDVLNTDLWVDLKATPAPWRACQLLTPRMPWLEGPLERVLLGRIPRSKPVCENHRWVHTLERIGGACPEPCSQCEENPAAGARYDEGNMQSIDT